MMVIPCLAIVFLCHLVPTGAQNNHLNVTVYPNCSQDSDTHPCLNIDNALDELSSGMTIYLKPGNHSIREQHLRDTRGITDVSIIGSGMQETLISCADQNGLAFIGMGNIAFINFTITNCGLTGTNLTFSVSLLEEMIDLWLLVPHTARVALLIGNCENVTIRDVHITNTLGLGLLGINIIGTSELSRVKFTRNVRPKCTDTEPILPSLITSDTYDQVGGGAYFLYCDYLDKSKAVNGVSLALTQAYFAYNTDCTYASNVNINFPYFTDGGLGLYQYAIGAGGGLSLVLAHSHYSIRVGVVSAEFHRNDARYGGGAYVATFAGFQNPTEIYFANCVFTENGVAGSDDGGLLSMSYCRGGAGLAIFADLVKPEHFQGPIPSPKYRVGVTVSNTAFVGNRADFQGGGVMAYSLFSTPHATWDFNGENYFSIVWRFINTVFVRNSAKYSSAGYFTQMATVSTSGSVLLIFSNLNVTRNSYVGAHGISLNLDEEASAIHLKDVSCAFYGNASTFLDNLGSAMRVESSIVVIGVSITFHRNKAHRGGALHFSGNSPALSLYPSSSLDFINNQALIDGGAIFFDSLPVPGEILRPLNYFECFIATPSFSVADNPDGNFGLFNHNISLSFSNNSAPLGSIIFGSSLETCPWAQNISRVDGLTLYQILQRDDNPIFIFDEEPIGQRMVSTLPAYLRVTLLPNGTKLPLKLFPGQRTGIGIEVLDFYNNTIPAVVTSVVNTNGVSAISTLGTSGFWHTSVYESQLSISGMHEGELNVSIVTETNSLTSSFAVYLLPCPIGFITDLETQECTCNDLLVNLTADFSCFSNSVSFRISDNVWVGVDANIDNPSTRDLIIHRCILNFCNILASNEIIPPKFDTQCNYNRAGLLCGACAEGYSNVFGTNECHMCSNYWLFLIPIFALAGAVLFAGIALLEITIDKGLTNSVLFFTNVVSVFSFLYPNTVYSYFFLPYRLLNLQIGVSTCFFDGMTALHRSFLQFVFPIYLYILMGIFTLLCRRYSWMSTSFSPAKTLMTLTAMCYFSVLTTCLEIVLTTKIVTVGGSVSYGWLADPSQRFFSGLHIVLGILGIAMVVLYIIPFPLLALFPTFAYKYLRKWSHFFDILLAAYKPKFRFWLGIRVILVMILILASRAPNIYAYMSSGIIVVIFSNVQTLLQPFKDKWANYTDVVLVTIVMLSFWGAQAISIATYTRMISIIADTYVAVLTVVGYSIFIALFVLHMHRQFPSLWPTLHAKVTDVLENVKERRKSAISETVVVEEGQNETIENPGFVGETVPVATRSSVYIRGVPSPTRYPGRVLGPPQYRESLLSSIEL